MFEAHFFRESVVQVLNWFAFLLVLRDFSPWTYWTICNFLFLFYFLFFWYELIEQLMNLFYFCLLSFQSFFAFVFFNFVLQTYRTIFVAFLWFCSINFELFVKYFFIVNLILTYVTLLIVLLVLFNKFWVIFCIFFLC